MDTTTLSSLVTQFGLPLSMLIVVTLAFVRGSIVPRFIYDQEHASRVDSEKRFDRSMDLSEALLTELKRTKNGSG